MAQPRMDPEAGNAEDGHEGPGAAHASDEDPLLRGERSTVMSVLRRNLPTFSFRGWRRTRSSEAAEAPESQDDVEAGLAAGERPAASGEGGQPPARSSSSSRDADGGGAGPSSEAEGRGSSANLAERQGLGGSPTSRASGLFSEILRLGSGLGARRGSSGSLQGSSNPICLICLEPLTPEDFESGEAIVLDCQCRGDMAMRHRTCAEKWVHVKGNRVCDVCKTVVKNLPDVPPRQPDTASTAASGEAGEDLRARAHLFGQSEPVPGGANVVFDCIRVTWVAMIICILFFEMNLANALWTGLIVGLAYTLFVRAMYRHQLAAIMREQQRMAAEGAAPQPHVVHVV